MSSSLTIYKASAGSGKTFTLAAAYIKLLLMNPQSYRQILAVTFTNKATNEMKERILQHLNGIAIGHPKSEPYLKLIKENLRHDKVFKHYTDEQLRENAQKAIKHMLHDYGRFRIETIDSFFQSVIRNIARELELAHNLRVEIDNKETLRKAIKHMLDDLTPNSFTLSLIEEYIEDHINNDKTWKVENELLDMSTKSMSEDFQEHREELKSILTDKQRMTTLRKELKELKEHPYKELKPLAEEFFATLENNNLTEKDFFQGYKSVAGYFKKLLSDNYELPALNSYSQPCLDGVDEKWVTAKHKRRDEILGLVHQKLLPLFREAEALKKQAEFNITSVSHTLKHIYQLQLLTVIDEYFHTINHEQNTFMLAETNNLLRMFLKEGDSSFVYEKIGSQIKNVMIDEFQDTSRMQWENFRQLLMEGLSQGEESLIVGDVKQSIYRFRNGDWRILNDLENTTDFKDKPELRTLDVNHRSEANIINFNNKLFTGIVRGFDDEALKHAYSDVVQKTTRQMERGLVSVDIIEADEEGNIDEKMMQKICETIKMLLARGVKPQDIAILQRKSKYMPLIASSIEREVGVPVISDEAFRMDASSGINMIVNALKYLIDPENKIARCALLWDYAESVLKKQDFFKQNPLNVSNEEILPAAFTERTEQLRLMPLHELVEELFRILQLGALQNQHAYFFFFFDKLDEYLNDNPSDIESFIHYWDERLSSAKIPGCVNEGIQMITAHKSKGLEYHTVLLPYCNWSLESEVRNPVFLATPKDAPYNDLAVIPVEYKNDLEHSTFQKSYNDERLQLNVDNLNMLYVALTRASKNLFIYTAPGSKHVNIGTLIQNEIQNMGKEGFGQYQADEGHYEFGSLYVDEEKKEKETTVEEELTNTLLLKPQQKTIQMISLSGNIEFRQSNRSAEFLADVENRDDTRQQYIDRGNILHHLFQNISTTADVDNAIQRLVFEGIITQDMIPEIIELTNKAFRNPQISDWYSGTWKLYNEKDIIWMSNGILLNRRPDRIMMREGEIVIIDFKFGQPKKAHHKQVNTYRDLLVQMGTPKSAIKGFLWYVDDDSIVEVH